MQAERDRRRCIAYVPRTGREGKERAQRSRVQHRGEDTHHRAPRRLTSRREHAPPEEERGRQEARVLHDVHAFVRDGGIEEHGRVPHPERDRMQRPCDDGIGDRAP